MKLRPLASLATAGVIVLACSATPIATPVATACDPTVPTSTPPPDLAATGPASYYGNAALWVELWPGGVVDVAGQQVTASGALGVKFPWWREGSGPLELTARRLDGPTGQVTVDVPQGYGPTGFQPSGVYFSGPGCWEVTGTVGAQSLTFVTLVRLAAASSAAPTSSQPG